MLRALLLQLSGQLPDSQTDLARLFDSSPTAVPTSVVLIAYLQRLILRFDQVYILLDSLDESPRYRQRDRVLDAIQTMRKWLVPGLHLLIISRDEPDIRESLSSTGNGEVIMKNAGIDQDISNFISRKLNTDPKIQKWRAHHDRIQQVLTERAHGVFRWVERQFESLKRCPRSESHLDYCLQSLPRGLDGTYERILCGIDEESIKAAHRILTLLCFSSRPLTVSELIEGIAVYLSTPARFDPRRRLQDADDLREICHGLIDFDAKIDDDMLYINSKKIQNTPFVRIAHFSVQEYLESDRIKQQRTALFGLQNASAHAEIAQICLVYLQEPDLSSGNLDQIKLDEFPLAHFAAVIANPVYYASLLGFDKIVCELLNTYQDDTVENQSLINTQGGECGNALQAASAEGHEKMVQVLIDAGANVNAQDGFYGNALQAASINNHENVVQMLINAEANVNALGGYHDNALCAASTEGHENVVRILIDAKANVNAPGGYHGNALYAASAKGHEKMVQMLIDAKANVNVQGGFYDNALQAASAKGHEKVVQKLIDAGANVNAQCGLYGSALEAAFAENHEKVVQMLIDAGAVDQEKSTEDRT